ncbi:hypothetical protein GGF42_006014 [Coemansia sp. RSA 2424]|nr:hypothetical protein GGF42_006014 [Coemansia sp. RSA 2424]
MQQPAAARISPGGPLPAPSITSPVDVPTQMPTQDATPSSSTTSTASSTSSTRTTTTTSTGYDYSFAVGISGFNGSITHYSVSYSDPYVSGIVGVGHAEPTPTPPPVVNIGIVCNKDFPGLLSILGLDLGIRLNLSLLGIDACIAL